MTIEYEDLLDDMKEAEKKKQEQRAVVRHLQEQYDRACNAWLAELCNQWDLDARYGYWVADEVGGTWIYGDDMPLGMDEIIYIVRENVPEQEAREWLPYCPDAPAVNTTVANIHKNILTADMPTYTRHLAPEGILIISGFLTADIPHMQTVADQNNLTTIHTTHQDGWAVMTLQKKN